MPITPSKKPSQVITGEASTAEGAQEPAAAPSDKPKSISHFFKKLSKEEQEAAMRKAIEITLAEKGCTPTTVSTNNSKKSKVPKVKKDRV